MTKDWDNPRPPRMLGDVLALDLAREWGFCRGLVGAPLVDCKIGHGMFGGKRDAPTEKVFCEAGAAIRTVAEGCSLIVYESAAIPQHMHGKTNVAAIRMGFGLAAIAEAVAYRMQIEVREARVTDVRDHFIQTHRLKRDDAKRAVWDRCKMLGVECKNFDESDAAALWHYMTAIIDPRTAARATPLFAKAGT